MATKRGRSSSKQRKQRRATLRGSIKRKSSGSTDSVVDAIVERKLAEAEAAFAATPAPQPVEVFGSRPEGYPSSTT